METINQQLGFLEPGQDEKSMQKSGLFADWYDMVANAKAGAIDKKTQHYSFVCDGIMLKRCDDKSKMDVNADKEWNDSPKRVVFLIKDQNQKGCSWIEDTRKWLVNRDDNWNVSSRFLRNLANALWGISKSSKDFLPTADCVQNQDVIIKVIKCFRETPFAFVECKKQGGIQSISNKELSYYLQNHEEAGLYYKKMLYKELDILNANIYVCTNSLIYKFVQEYIKHNYPNTDLTPIKSIKKDGEFEASVMIHQPSKSVILCSYHPSARMGYKRYYDGVVTHYQAFVQSEYYSQFFK